MPDAGALRVTVLYSPEPRRVLERQLLLPEGTTLRQAVLASGLARDCPEVESGSMQAGVWGRKASWEQPLREGDRVEIYRPLKVDPKFARRERFRKQGARAAGLFAQRRPGGKPGY